MKKANKWHRIGDIRVSEKDGVKKTRLVLSKNVRISVLNEETGEYEPVQISEYGTTYLKSKEKIIDDLESQLENGRISSERYESQKSRLEEKGIKYDIIIPPSDS
jgi:hypothetical protein